MNGGPSRDLRDVAACLGWLAAQAGRPVSAERLLASLSDGRDAKVEVDIEGLSAALRRVGLTLDPLPAVSRSLKESQLPAIGFPDRPGAAPPPARASSGSVAANRLAGISRAAEASHYVLGFATAPDGSLIARRFEGGDPVGKTVSPDMATSIATGRLWRVATLPPAPEDEPEHATARHWFWSRFGRETGTYVYVILAAIATNLIALVSSLYVMAVYDRVIPNNALTTLWTLTIGAAIVYGFDFVFRVLRGALVDGAARRMDVLISRDAFDHLLDMRLEYRRGSAGSTAAMLRDWATVQDFVSSSTLLALVDLPFVALFLAVLYVIAPTCFWPALATIPIALALGLFTQNRLNHYAGAAYAHGHEKFGALVETLTALESVRGLGAERTMRRRWRDRVGTAAMSSWGVKLWQQVAVNASVSVQQFATLAVVVAGVLSLADGRMSQGALIAAVMLSGRALAPIGQVTQIMSRYSLTQLSLTGLNKFFGFPTERPMGRAFLDRPALRGGYEIKDLAFAYPGNPPVPILAGLNLAIRPGERIGVIGRVGSGKSTLLKLLMGLYQQTNGTIRLDGVDLRQIDPAQLRADVAYVSQTPVLVAGTVRENIAIARPEATDEEILHAATLAGADAFIKRHPLGYDLPISERGEGLSAGQRQAIALAQALIKKAEVWLLDEPTSALDDRTEHELKQALELASFGKTLLVVTHKPALLELVDRLVIVDNGKVVMDGPKNQVLAALRGGDVRSAEQTP